MNQKSKFVTRKWKIFNDQSNANYDVIQEMKLSIIQKF